MLPQKQVAFWIYTLVACLYKFTHRGDVGLHRQQVKEGKELNGKDGVNLCGGQHQHSQREQHFETRLVSPPLRHSVINIHNFRDERPHTGLHRKLCAQLLLSHLENRPNSGWILNLVVRFYLTKTHLLSF